MWFRFCPILLVLLSAAFVCAQEATPSPAPEATPAVAATPTPPVVPEATPEAPPEPPPPLAPAEAAPQPTPDVIPMGGAPLDTQNLAPLDPSMPDDAFTQPNAVIPDVAPPPVGQALDNAQEKLRLQNIRYREVRVQVEKDPQVENLLTQSNKAKTSEGKRAALREYYRLLFKKMVAVDKSLEEKCRLMEDAYIRRLAQDRLEPTIPLNPPPTPEPIQ
jgi:hypothetical protein